MFTDVYVCIHTYIWLFANNALSDHAAYTQPHIPSLYAHTPMRILTLSVSMQAHVRIDIHTQTSADRPLHRFGVKRTRLECGHNRRESAFGDEHLEQLVSIARLHLILSLSLPLSLSLSLSLYIYIYICTRVCLSVSLPSDSIYICKYHTHKCACSS